MSIRSNIWLLEGKRIIVVPTNIGWTRSGENVMGRGVAKQADLRYRGLAKWYGEFCRKHGKDTPVVRHPLFPVALFPVKLLDIQKPHLSWKGSASIARIHMSAKQLSGMEGQYCLPKVGCGNGGLKWEGVRPVLEKYLRGSRFLLIEPPWERSSR